MITSSSSSRRADVALFGAVHMDTIAHARIVIERETSTPARFLRRPGGVATNVARALRLLDTDCVLVGAIGQDDEGTALARQLAQEGIDLSGIVRCNLPTGRYLALHDPDGSLASAVVDDRITDDLSENAFKPFGAAAAGAGLWFVEANLPTALIASLLDAAEGRRIVADAVSIAKAPRLRPVLPQIDMLFCNRAEAAILLSADQDRSVTKLAEDLCASGAKACCVTNGAGPVGYCGEDGVKMLSPFQTTPVDVTGAGDALIAGWLAARMRNTAPLAALRTGLAAAAIALEAPGGAPENLNWEAIARKLSTAGVSSRDLET